MLTHTIRDIEWRCADHTFSPGIVCKQAIINPTLNTYTDGFRPQGVRQLQNLLIVASTKACELNKFQNFKNLSSTASVDNIREFTKLRRQRRLQRKVAFVSELKIQKTPCFSFEFASHERLSSCPLQFHNLETTFLAFYTTDLGLRSKTQSF